MTALNAARPKNEHQLLEIFLKSKLEQALEAKLMAVALEEVRRQITPVVKEVVSNITIDQLTYMRNFYKLAETLNLHIHINEEEIKHVLDSKSA